MSKIITEERAEKLESFEYLNDILEYLLMKYKKKIIIQMMKWTVT